MKKTLALLIGIGILAMTTNCKQAIPNNTQTNTTENAPISKLDDAASLCTEYGKLKTLAEQQLWIQNHLDVICNGSLTDCLINRHSITADVYNDMKKVYWDDAVPETTTKKWSDFKSDITESNCLGQKYIGFVIKDHKVDKLVLYNQYTTHASCYSIALFEAIRKKYGLNNNDTFKFVLGQKEKISNKIEVLFEVKGKHYDLTIDPMR